MYMTKINDCRMKDNFGMLKNRGDFQIPKPPHNIINF